MWMRLNALALAALFSFLTADAVQAQMGNPAMDASRRWNQQEMMLRSQQYEMERQRLRAARAKSQKPVNGAKNNKNKKPGATASKPKAPAKN
jgi:hypothetical protein